MSILGKYTDNIIEDDDNNETEGYTLPVVIKKDKEDSLKKALTISALLHPAVLGSVYLISLILLFFGISLNVFERPKPKMKDIEFVLVENEDTPINKNTPYRSDRNSRAGGHHDPKKKVSMPSPAPAAAQKPTPAPQAPAKTQQPAKSQQPAPKVQQPKPQPAKQEAPKQVTKPAPKQEKTQQAPAPKAPQQAKPAPPTARPSIKPPMTPKPVANRVQPFRFRCHQAEQNQELTQPARLAVQVLQTKAAVQAVLSQEAAPANMFRHHLWRRQAAVGLLQAKSLLKAEAAELAAPATPAPEIRTDAPELILLENPISAPICVNSREELK